MNFAVVKMGRGNNLANVLANVIDHPTKEVVSTATINDTPYEVKLNTNLNAIEGFPIGEAETLDVDGNTIKCTGFSIYTERARRSDVWLDENGQLKPKRDLINQFQADFIVYECNGDTYALGSAGINRTRALLKDAFNLQTDEMVIQYSDVTEDLLYWLFKRFIDTPADSLLGAEQLHITSLESYVGKTRDNVNAMRGEGDGISVILGTLAFLFNNEELKSIRPTVQYGNEKVLIEIGLTGTFKLWENSYRGRAYRHLIDKRKGLMLALYVNLIIIPTLVRSYKENLRNRTWSKQLKIDFIKRLGERITREVANVLAKIENVPDNQVDTAEESGQDQLEMNLDDVRELIDDEEILPFDEEHLEEPVGK